DLQAIRRGPHERSALCHAHPVGAGDGAPGGARARQGPHRSSRGERMSGAAEIPQGFEALRRGSSPFLASLGTLHVKDEGGGVVIGLRIEEKHLNTQGVAHGGMLVTLADSAMGIVIAMRRTPP